MTHCRASLRHNINWSIQSALFESTASDATREKMMFVHLTSLQHKCDALTGTFECHTAVRWFLKQERTETISKAIRLAQCKLQNLELQVIQLSNFFRPSLVFFKETPQEQPNLFARERTP